MVNVGKLWGDAKFSLLPPFSKLLYCYLVSQPNISTLGVIQISTKRLILDLGITEEDLEDSLLDLEDSNLIVVDNLTDTELISVVVDHFKTLPKSKTVIRKAIDEGKKSKESLKYLLRDIYLSSYSEESSFKPPTPEEVSDYALSIGHIVNGKNFVSYYSDNDWYDKNNKKVRNWKAKVRKVWCRDENKLEPVKGAPKGLEYFFIELEDGTRVQPQSWVKGLPSHSNHIYTQYLIREFQNVQR